MASDLELAWDLGLAGRACEQHNEGGLGSEGATGQSVHSGPSG